MKYKIITNLVATGLFLSLTSGCDKENCSFENCAAEHDGDTDIDTDDTDDTDADTDADTGTDTDSDTDTDTDTDTDSNFVEDPTCYNGICEGDPCVGVARRQCSDEGHWRYCQPNEFWGECITEPECEVGTSGNCWACELTAVGPSEIDTCDDNDDGSTPLVLAFDNEPVSYSASAASFDIAGNQCLATDWPTSQTPWLALDRDRNGRIDDGRELFGNGTVLTTGMKARHGFAALADLDTNGDNRITPADARFSELVLWADHDGDRVSNLWELTPLDESGVTAIELDGPSRIRVEQPRLTTGQTKLCGEIAATLSPVERECPRGA